MKILITGAEGMLGKTLARHLADHELTLTDVDDLDITHSSKVFDAVEKLKPQAIIHAAAMTQVDDCESRQDQAFTVNAIGSKNVAVAAERVGAHLVAISTDYVFSGDLERPYHEWDATGPRSVYGASKLAGEQAIMAHCPRHSIVRIAWLYGPGGPSFLHTMLRLLSQDQDTPLKVVNDQVGNPTSTDVVAAAVKDCLGEKLFGTVHATCEGEATWYDFTREIARLSGTARPVEPCSTENFPRPAPRPRNSRLENRVRRLHGLSPLPHWQEALKLFLDANPGG